MRKTAAVVAATLPMRTTRPDTSHAHAADLAAHAAHSARLNGADVDECARVYAATYAAHLPAVASTPSAGGGVVRPVRGWARVRRVIEG